MMPCSSVDGYRRFGRDCYHRHQDREGTGVGEAEVGTGEAVRVERYVLSNIKEIVRGVNM
jgi:hypothetical protein